MFDIEVFTRSLHHIQELPIKALSLPVQLLHLLFFFPQNKNHGLWHYHLDDPSAHVVNHVLHLFNKNP